MKKTIVATVSFLVLVGFARLSVSTDEPVTLPVGSALRVELTTTLSTKTNQTGDPFTGQVTEPIIVKGEEVVPSGSTVEGRISYLSRPGRGRGIAEMRLTPEVIVTPDNTRYTISAGLEEAQGAYGAKVKGKEGTIAGEGKSKKGGAIETGAGAGAGAAIGGLADGGTGALYGAGIGAAAGIVHTILRKHKDILLPQGTELSFVISRATIAKKVAGTTADKGAENRSRE